MFFEEINNDNNFFLYPNPANDYFFINGSTSTDNIKIYDMLGKVYYLNYNFIPSKGILVDLNNLKNGYYIIKVESLNKSIRTLKLFKN
jgi:hypothetical protein